MMHRYPQGSEGSELDMTDRYHVATCSTTTTPPVTKPPGKQIRPPCPPQMQPIVPEPDPNIRMIWRSTYEHTYVHKPHTI